MRSIICISTFLIFLPTTGFAEIYQYTDTSGVVTYSDQPHSKSEPITLGAPNISKTNVSDEENTEKTPVKTSDTKPIKQIAPQKLPYQTFAIATPKNNENFHNAENLNISLAISPNLQTGDQIQIFFDGEPLEKPSTQTNYSIPKIQNGKNFLQRGEHRIYAVLLNAQGQRLTQTETITIYLHYASVL